jgi:quinol monooxygenase YgiN
MTEINSSFGGLNDHRSIGNESKSMIIVTGSLIVKGGRLADALTLSLEHVRRSRAENGCISHTVHRDVENPARLVFVEEWSDEAALAAHFAVPASRAFAKAISELAVEAPKLNIFEARRISG